MMSLVAKHVFLNASHERDPVHSSSLFLLYMQTFDTHVEQTNNNKNESGTHNENTRPLASNFTDRCVRGRAARNVT